MASSRVRLIAWNPDRALNAMGDTMLPRMRQATEIVRSDVVRSMRGGGSPHTPSQPGQPPAIDTGAYRARIYADARRTGGGGLIGRVVSPSVQALALEFGYAPNNLAPRPHLRPALARNSIRIYRTLTGSSREGPASLREIAGAMQMSRTVGGG
jgi:hypothetical protein